MIVVAIDPGTKKHGWSEVTRSGSAQVRYVRSGHHEHAAVLERLRDWAQRKALVFIEQPVIYPKMGAAAQALLETAQRAGGLQDVAELLGMRVELVTAQRWRHALCGVNSPNDATIANAVRVFVVGMPTSSNEHERDALGLAVVAAWKSRTTGGAR